MMRCVLLGGSVNIVCVVMIMIGFSLMVLIFVCGRKWCVNLVSVLVLSLSWMICLGVLRNSSYVIICCVYLSLMCSGFEICIVFCIYLVLKCRKCILFFLENVMGVKCGLCGVLSIGMLLCLLMFGWCFMCGGWSFLELL